MKTRRFVNRGITVLLLVTAAAVALAPAAGADRGYGRVRYRGAGPGWGHGVRYVGRGPVIVERHSDAGPAIVGFLGGLVLGSVLSNAHPAPPPPVYDCPAPVDYRPAYEYYDPYCRVAFASLEAYDRHLDRHRHPAAVDVVDTRTGRRVDSLEWQDGRWASVRDYDRDYDRGDYDRSGDE